MTNSNRTIEGTYIGQHYVPGGQEKIVELKDVTLPKDLFAKVYNTAAGDKAYRRINLVFDTSHIIKGELTYNRIEFPYLASEISEVIEFNIGFSAFEKMSRALWNFDNRSGLKRFLEPTMNLELSLGGE